VLPVIWLAVTRRRPTVKVHIREQEDGEFDVLILGLNGEPWYRSAESYTQRTDAVRSWEHLKARFELSTDIEVEHLDKEGQVLPV
jgi:hypothetical protein